jgi:hypothetical protein
MTLENSPSALAGAAIDYDLPCPKCRYNLKGLSAARCPECGYTLLPGELIASDIPWAHRRSRGRVRTYLHTVWRATFNMPRFFAELDRHVSYADAQRFRWTTILVAYAPWLLATIATVAAGQGQSLNILEFSAPWQAVAAGAVPHLCLLLFLGGRDRGAQLLFSSAASSGGKAESGNRAELLRLRGVGVVLARVRVVRRHGVPVGCVR